MLKIVKTDVEHRVIDWYRMVRPMLVLPVHVPNMKYTAVTHTLEMEFPKAVPLCVTDRVESLTPLFYQIEAFSRRCIPSVSWDEYVDNLLIRMDVLPAVTDHLRRNRVEGGTFCHGDLTLENVLVDYRSELVLIDPNPRDFFSHWLDYGKLAFSLQYHDRFKSYWLTDVMHNAVARRLDGLDEDVLKSVLMTHIIRLQGYCNEVLIKQWLTDVISARPGSLFRATRG
jgi:hypothetical protein